MKLFVDDYRTPDITGIQIVRTYKDAILLLDLFEFDFISLDYDLSSKYTGLDIIKYLIKIEKYPKHLNIHSTHINGSAEMYRYAKKYLPDSVNITRNTL